jgi:hypothetical protein
MPSNSIRIVCFDVGGVLEVGMVDPYNIEARDALQFISSKIGLPFKIFSLPQADFDRISQSYEGLTSQITKALGDLDLEIQAEGREEGAIGKGGSASGGEVKIVEDAPVTKIVAVILQHASSGNASDVHIEPLADNVRVRFRVDGVLYTSLFLPSSVHDAVVARIKILTNMKLDERDTSDDFYQTYGMRNGLASVGGSDYHGLDVGYAVTAYTGEDVLEDIKQQRTAAAVREDVESGWLMEYFYLRLGELRKRLRQKSKV